MKFSPVYSTMRPSKIDNDPILMIFIFCCINDFDTSSDITVIHIIIGLVFELQDLILFTVGHIADFKFVFYNRSVDSPSSASHG